MGGTAPWTAESERLLVSNPDLLAKFVAALSAIMIASVSLTGGSPPMFVDRP